MQRADAVLLVVSPRSMASPNVEREITVAAEEARRIVPLVLEPAEMTGSILFELAGSQQISFAGPEFDIAMAGLGDDCSNCPQSLAEDRRCYHRRCRRDATIVASWQWWS